MPGRPQRALLSSLPEAPLPRRDRQPLSRREVKAALRFFRAATSAGRLQRPHTDRYPADLRNQYAALRYGKENAFRQDLLYRINTVEIKLPPLRDRREDIPILADHFLTVYHRKYQKPGLNISSATMKELYGLPLPAISGSCAMRWNAPLSSATYQLDISDFILHFSSSDGLAMTTYPTTGRTRQLQPERYRSLGYPKALTKHAGNISCAADELGLTWYLYRRMAKYEL